MKKRLHWFEILLAIAVLVTHGYVAFAPNASLLMWFRNDDAFFYFKVAQNIAAGLGSTFDGIGPANGYHPLWMLVCIPVFALAKFDLFLPLRLLAVILAGLNLGTGILLFRLLSRLTRQPVAMLAAAFWVFYPGIHAQTTQGGLETGVNVFFLAWLLYAVSQLEPDEPPSLRQMAILGVLASLAVLSRLDNIFLLLILGIWAVWRDEKFRNQAMAYILLTTLGVLASFIARLGFKGFYDFAVPSMAMIAISLAIRLPIYYFGGLTALDWRDKPKALTRIFITVSLASGLVGLLMLAISLIPAVGGFPRSALAVDWALALLSALLVSGMGAWLGETARGLQDKNEERGLQSASVSGRLKSALRDKNEERGLQSASVSGRLKSALQDKNEERGLQSASVSGRLKSALQDKNEERGLQPASVSGRLKSALQDKNEERGLQSASVSGRLKSALQDKNEERGLQSASASGRLKSALRDKNEERGLQSASVSGRLKSAHQDKNEERGLQSASASGRLKSAHQDKNEERGLQSADVGRLKSALRDKNEERGLQSASVSGRLKSALQIPWGYFKARWQIWLKRALVYFGILGGVVLVYMAANYVLFGTPMPVSGQIKQWWGSLDTVYGKRVQEWDMFLGFNSEGRVVAFATLRDILSFFILPGTVPFWGLLAAYALVGLGLLSKRETGFGSGLDRSAWLAALTGALIHVWSYNARGYVAIREWYWAAQMLVSVIFAGLFWDALLKKLPLKMLAGAGAVLGMAVFAVSALSIVRLLPYDTSRLSEDLTADVRFLEANTEPGALIGMTGGGMAGYFIHDRTIVNLDGLINSPEYFRLHRQFKSDGYLDRIGLDYVFGNEYIVTESDPYGKVFAGRLAPLKTFANPHVLFRYLPEGEAGP